MTNMQQLDQNPPSFWSISVTELLNRLQTTSDGLTTDEAKKRLISYGANRVKPNLNMAYEDSGIFLMKSRSYWLSEAENLLTTYLLLFLIVVIYIIAAEITKTLFYRRVRF